MFKSKVLKIIVVDSAMIFSSMLLATQASANPVSNHSYTASADPYACSQAEVNTLIDNYKKAQENTIDATKPPVFSNFRDQRLIINKDDPNNLCDVLANPNFKNPLPSWDEINTAWNTLKALYTAKAGLDYGAIFREAANKLYEKGIDKLKGGLCKLSKKTTQSIHDNIEDAYQGAKDNLESNIVNSDVGKNVGVNSVGSNSLKEIAESQTKKQLGEYDRYGHWYEKDFISDEKLQKNIDSLINSEIDKKKNDLVDKHISSPKTTPLDKIKDLVSPN